MEDKRLYKINEAIDVMYGAVGAETGISDLTLTPTNPSGADLTPITMTEVGNGLYKASFTPNVTGRWKIRITSATYEENGSAEYYWVGDYDSVEGQPFILVDSDGDVADITASGRLKVSQEPPIAPPGTTSVIVVEYDTVATEDDNVYIIPTGEKIIINRLSAGAEASSSGSVIELWYDPNGDGTGMTIIDVIFCNGTSDQHDLSENIIGDGTKSIRLRRRDLNIFSSSDIFARWEGYY